MNFTLQDEERSDLEQIGTVNQEGILYASAMQPRNKPRCISCLKNAQMDCALAQATLAENRNSSYFFVN